METHDIIDSVSSIMFYAILSAVHFSSETPLPSFFTSRKAHFFFRFYAFSAWKNAVVSSERAKLRIRRERSTHTHTHGKERQKEQKEGKKTKPDTRYVYPASAPLSFARLHNLSRIIYIYRARCMRNEFQLLDCIRGISGTVRAREARKPLNLRRLESEGERGGKRRDGQVENREGDEAMRGEQLRSELHTGESDFPRHGPPPIHCPPFLYPCPPFSSLPHATATLVITGKSGGPTKLIQVPITGNGRETGRGESADVEAPRRRERAPRLLLTVELEKLFTNE